MKKISRKVWVMILAVGLVTAGYFVWRNISGKQTTATVQTETVSKGTLITSIAATGSITAGNTTNISTKASGTVTKVYVKNGDLVGKGQKILELTLDSDGISNRSSAWQSYLRAQEAVVSATKDKQDLSIQVWEDRQAIVDAEEVVAHVENLAGLTDDEKNQKREAIDQAKLAFDVTASEFEHADAVIAAAKIEQQAAYLNYQNVSGSIVAPSAGIINNLTLTVGSTLSASTSQSTSTGSTYASSQNIAFIRAANNQYQARVSLTEVDAPKVQAGQKVNITLDAYSDKSFTGKVLAVDISGSSSSGVSSYPATIIMDPTELAIYPNMSVSATIITEIQTDVLLVPSSAVLNSTGVSTVQIMKDGQEASATVETGSSNDTQTVITSGLGEGDTIVTGSSTSAKNDNTSSEFSNTRQGAVGFGGAPGF